MRAWFYQHRKAGIHALGRLFRQPLGTILSALVVGIALALPAGGFVLVDNVGSLARGVTGSPEISLYLALDATDADVAAIETRLRDTKELTGFQFVARDAALKQLADNGLADVLEGLPQNPLPHAFIITPASDDPQLFDTLKARFSQWPKVDHVQLDAAWVQRLHALLGLAELGVSLLAALLAAALVIITFNTIRLQILTQRAEIEVTRLLGATDQFIRRPFYWLGCLQGLLGGLIAWGIVTLGIALLRPPVEELASAYGAVFSLGGPSPAQTATLLAVAIALGWLGTALSVRRHLNEIG
ncbi:ABC transporter permease [Nitrogeniibacter mangrovi]|uniref:Cell division protein FtsX n=1 Tax=Nitrogeniibacter mangrovi TaxID=2016596 RepID=A0A6C1B928_9RHOO|nr:permease-like cell division protein FtsX [Nitrogeniibacter mangrovi]QID19883.1 ABC transporter permease [Nitrogeniibacter mangrovi]